MSPFIAFLAGALWAPADTVEHRRPPPTAVHATEARPQQMPMAADHTMFERRFADGWRVAGMAQVFPALSVGRTPAGDTPFDDTGLYLTQPAAMINLESPGGVWALRVTPNFEGLTLEDGELTFGGWGEGFLDSRHPHTLLHEVMLSVNFWGDGADGVSLSAGKGFAPYGTEDPMSRPVLKYPTNHHLSQILERYTLNAAVLRDGWSFEAGLFGGSEPEGPYDMSNYDSFGDSWSVRVGRRFGAERMGSPRWEVLGSWASVAEAAHGADHGDEGHEGEEAKERTRLLNGQVRFDGAVGAGRLYALLEASSSAPENADGFWSVVGEARLASGRHQPYARLELATRPEYDREAADGSGFFRYDHDASPVGATRWTIASVGYGYTLTEGSVSLRPFVEAQWYDMAAERGGLEPAVFIGDTRAYTLSLGARIFLGGDPMRMGTYGVLDPMTRMGRDGGMAGMAHQH